MNNKILLMIVGALLPLSALSAPIPPLKSLGCDSGHAQIGNFSVTELDTDHPVTDLARAPDVDVEKSEVVTRLCASNESDGQYCMVFFNEDLDQLARGETRRVRGLMSSSSSSETDLVSCTPR
jgi:hypothetical protein